MNKYNMGLSEDQADQRDEVDYYSPRSKHVTNIETICFCPCCNKRLTTADDLYICELDVYCDEKCAIEFKRQEESA